MWAKIDERFPDHTKLRLIARRLGGQYGQGRAIGVWLAMLCWSNERRTDGYLPREEVRRCGADPKPLEVAEALARPVTAREAKTHAPLRAGQSCLWEIVEGGFRIHDYAQYQPTAADFEARVRAGRAGGLRAAFLRKQRAPINGHERRRS